MPVKEKAAKDAPAKDQAKARADEMSSKSGAARDQASAAKDQAKGKADEMGSKSGAMKDQAGAMGSKAGSARDQMSQKADQAQMSRQRYESARTKANMASEALAAKDLEYLSGKNGTADKILQARDRANQTGNSVEQRKSALADAQTLVKSIIDKIEKGGK